MYIIYIYVYTHTKCIKYIQKFQTHMQIEKIVPYVCIHSRMYSSPGFKSYSLVDCLNWGKKSTERKHAFDFSEFFITLAMPLVPCHDHGGKYMEISPFSPFVQF